MTHETIPKASQPLMRPGMQKSDAPLGGHKIRLRLQHLEQGFQRGVRLMVKT